MSDSKPTKEQLQNLAQRIKEDQAKVSSAEKRVKIKSSFQKAVKKITRTPPPKKEAR